MPQDLQIYLWSTSYVNIGVMVLAGSWRRLRVVPYIMIDEKKVDFSHRGDEGYYIAKLK